MENTKLYTENAQVNDVIWAIINEHPGATSSEIIAYAMEKGIPKDYALSCLTHSVMIERVSEKMGATRHYARNREEIEREIQQRETEWLAELLKRPGRKKLLFHCSNCGQVVTGDIHADSFVGVITESGGGTFHGLLKRHLGIAPAKGEAVEKEEDGPTLVN
jgi:hypothetical protein